MRIPSDLWLGATRNASEASVDDSRCGDQPPGTSDSWTECRGIASASSRGRQPGQELSTLRQAAGHECASLAPALLPPQVSLS